MDVSTILASVDAVQNKQALESQARMECVHALLRRGSHMAAQDPAAFGDKWKEAEARFIQLLGWKVRSIATF